MTWVIGASSLFGYGVMVSDVRITFSDGTEEDILRKVYPVAPYMLAGFAGSVRIGMTLIDNLQRSLHQALFSLKQKPEGHTFVFNPDVVITDWAPHAAEIFSKMPKEERDLGSQILIVGVDSRKNIGESNFPHVHISKLDWPKFEPEYSEGNFQVKHIGSGSDIKNFVSAISEYFNIGSPTLQAEVGGTNAWASMLGNGVGRVVKEHPVGGIGAHVNIDICRRGSFNHINNDEKTFYPDGKIEEFNMPAIAQNYNDFCIMCNKIGKGAVGAIA